MYKYFRGPGCPRKFFDGNSTFPGLVIWNETSHTKKMWSTNSLRAAFVGHWLPLSSWRITIGCKRELNDAVGTYCGSKDRQFIEHWAKSCHAFAISSSDLLVSKKRLSRVKQLATCSCAVKWTEMFWLYKRLSVVKYTSCFLFSWLVQTTKIFLQHKFPDLW